MKLDNISILRFWQKHIDIQEEILRLHADPISVIPESAKITGDKLFLEVNENEKSNKVLKEIANTFEIDVNEISNNDGFFFSDANVDIETKNFLSESAARNHINFIPTPIIDGYINEKNSPIKNLKKVLQQIDADFSFDNRNRLQISLINLKRLKKIITNSKLNIQIPEKVSIIMSVYPNPVYFLSKEFPKIKFMHKIKSCRNYDNDLDKSTYTNYGHNTIEVYGGYLNENILRRLNDEIGLSLIGYEYTFSINPNVVSKYDPATSSNILPKKNNNAFIFHTKLIENNNISVRPISNAYHEEKWLFDVKYMRLKKFFDSYFGAENVNFEPKFIYTYDLLKFQEKYLPKQNYSKSDFWEQVHNSFKKDDNISVSENTTSIGIDFNWEREEIDEVISNAFTKCPTLNFYYYYENHKCNIDFQVQYMSLNEVENQLRNKFPSIHTKRDDKNGTLYFYQEYQTPEQFYRLQNIIESEINNLNSDTYDVGLYPIQNGKEKYIIEIDVQSREESLKAAIKELRGADFSFGDITFGKLIRIKYPEMIFDISGNNYEKTKQIFESQVINYIEPNLTGELEKLNRLKKAQNSIRKGTNLQNPNLRKFIFDAKKAKKIEDVDYHINPQSGTFNDLENNLLNEKVNMSQKQAIIKTLLTEDLVLIQGPPGTGKSTAIAEIIWQHIRKNPDEKILLTSETNLAVDNAINKTVNENHNLVKPIRIGGEDKLEMEGRQFSLDIMKRWVENGSVEINEEELNEDEELLPQKLILQNWIDNIKRRIKQTELSGNIFTLWNKILSNPSKQIREIVYNNYLKNCNVIGATCSSIGKVNSNGNWTSFYRTYQEIFVSCEKIKFTTVIQDESSKATPAELSLPLIYGKKNIIIGDHRQLPPMLDKEEFVLSLDYLLDTIEIDKEKNKIRKLKSFVLENFDEMETSYFERLFEEIDDSLKGIFNLQYRMHPDINDVIKQFYTKDGGLECGLINPIDLGVNDPNMNNVASRYHGIEIDGLISKDNHVVWIDTRSPELLDGTSRVNYGEIEAIRHILTKFRDSESFRQYQSFWTNPEDKQIGLISFYGKQIRLLRNLRNEFVDIPIRVSTVDRFQGMERNVIIVSMVRSNRIATDKKQKPDIELYGKLGFPEQKSLGFAQSPNRLNVALSRAKRLLIIVGNSELFRQKDIYNNVYQTIANNPNGKIIKYETL